MLVEVTLDASEMEPPKPFERATEILRQLEPGQYLRMLHRRLPYPLFEFCQAMSLTHSVIKGSATPYQISVYFPADEQALRQEGVL